MSSLSQARAAEAARLQRGALQVGVAALVICAVGAIFMPAPFFRAYLTAYQFVVGLGLGSLILLMLYHLTGGAWGYLIRRPLEAGARTLPLLALLFIPIGVGLHWLYPWARPEEVAASHDLQHKQVYLNVPFFWLRQVLYFVLWSGLGLLLSYWSRRFDETGDPIHANRSMRLSGIGLVVYGVSMLFASTDWVMSLQPSFRSTIFGPLMASGHLLSGMAFALVVLAWVAPEPPVAEHLSQEALNDQGNMLLTFLVVWGYLVFFQFMLIWVANLPYEVIWYLPRSRDGWQWLAWALLFLHFVFPFFLLLQRDVKRNPAVLASVAGLLLFMQLVYVYWHVMPSFADARVVDHWFDFLTPLALGGPWLAYYLWQLQRSPLMARDPVNEQAALHYHELDLEAAAWNQEIGHE